MNPQLKEKPIRLKGKAYTEFRKKVFGRAFGNCETCKGHAPLLWYGVFNEITCGHVHHVKSRGAGGEDVLSEDVVWLCYNCHLKTHGPKWSKKNDCSV